MSNEKLSLLFFDIGLALAMVAMVIGPFEITSWALTAGVISCVFAVASVCLSFLDWDAWENPAPPQSGEKPEDSAGPRAQ